MFHALTEDHLLAVTALDAVVARGTGHHPAGSALDDLHLPVNEILALSALTTGSWTEVADPALDAVTPLDAGLPLPNVQDRALLPRVLPPLQLWSRRRTQ